MQLANTTLLKHKFLLPALFSLTALTTVNAQDNSPYSRYGLGNQTPRTNVISRGMGGVSAAYVGTYLGYAQGSNYGDSTAFTEVTSVNYNNPASFASFQANMEQRSGKVASARVILDVGINFSSRKLAEPNTPLSFTSSDAIFSHVYVGVPIRKNWGLAFGIRPISRISYNILRSERLRNSGGGNIDSVATQFAGNGGTFLPTIGTGFGSNNFSVGVNVGYMFGKKEISTRRAFINDSIEYAASNHTTNSSFGNLFFNAGAQYKIELNRKSILRLGVTGNWKQTLDGSQDILRQTYVRNSVGEELQVDSVFQQTGAKGDVIYPASYTAGFMLDNAPGDKTRGWSIGVDYVKNNWDDFRFFGAKDLVQNNWELRFGGQLTTVGKPTRYGQTISYRFGGFVGPDYVNADGKLPQYGLSFGLGLPLISYNQAARTQYSVLNFAFEYSKRGNDQNKIREDLFRVSVGLNFTDLWFGKRRYD
ncbi:MAG: hypothetical protein EOO10_06950 [Chitinophagaceae bacterium]|nr:MAG: hypothetical protein EOO10_06950 [Chitinophagaceae bacterium]